MRPDSLLLFLGPPKAGSTFFYDALRHHAEVSTAPAKELFYFDRFHQRGEDWYFGQFTPAKVYLDCSHDYLFSAAAADRVRALRGVRKVGVVVLRDPLDRAVSAVSYLRWQGRTNLGFHDAVGQIEEILGHGDYGRWIPKWRDALGEGLQLGRWRFGF